MAFSCLRTKICKLCMVFVLLVLGLASVLLWYRAARDGAVEYVIPVINYPAHALSIKILPEAPRIQKGATAQLVCIVTGARVTAFSHPPSLPSSLHSSIHVSSLPGGAVMIVESVTLRHAGHYTCHAVGTGREELKLSVELAVDPVAAGTESNQSQKSTSSPSHSPSSPTTLTSITQLTNAVDKTSPTSANQTSISGTSSLPLDSQNTAVHVQTEKVGTKRRSKRDSGVQQTSDDDLPEDLIQQGKFQRLAVRDFCSKFDPHPSNQSHPIAYSRHILIDDKHRVVYCFLPKVGCTNLKLLLFASQGLIPRSELHVPRDEVDQSKLMSVVQNSSLRNKRHYLSHYFKYIMVRNPLERLASAFRSKIERYNLTGTRANIPHYNWARAIILKRVHPRRYRDWIRGDTKPVSISFSDFISYWLDPKDAVFQYDDHFMSMLNICQPCRTRFDFYGNFHHFERDTHVLIDKIGASMSDLRQGYYSEDASTGQRVKLYYSTLSDPQKRAVLKKLTLELEFHYTIFPEERDSHRQIMSIDADLPL